MTEPAAFFELDGYRVEAWPAPGDCPGDENGEFYNGCECDPAPRWDVFCEGELVGEIKHDAGGYYEGGNWPPGDRVPELRQVLAGICYDIARMRRPLDPESTT